MLREFWYACEFSKSVRRDPQPLRLLDQSIVLYRDEHGRIRALSDRCPHQGAALHLGTVESGCIRCPYHGWQFAADGLCIQIPSNRPGKVIPVRARVLSFPVEEKYGLVWIYLGQRPAAERPPIPDLSDIELPGTRAVSVKIPMSVHYTRSMQNNLDVSHLPFVHTGSFWTREHWDLGDLAVATTAFGGRASITLARPRKRFWNRSTSARTVAIGCTFFLPNLVQLSVTMDNWRLLTIVSHLPVTADETLSLQITTRNFLTSRWFDGLALRRGLRVLRQDYRVLASQQPRHMPDRPDAEVLVPADALYIAYRQLYQRCLEHEAGARVSDLPHRSERAILRSGPG